MVKSVKYHPKNKHKLKTMPSYFHYDHLHPLLHLHREGGHLKVLLKMVDDRTTVDGRNPAPVDR